MLVVLALLAFDVGVDRACYHLVGAARLVLLDHRGPLGVVAHPRAHRYLLIDFDGPVCSIYAGLPAPQVADQLRKLFTGHQLPEAIQQTGDPIEVSAYAGTVSPDLAARVEAEMTDLEVEATATAKPIQIMFGRCCPGIGDRLPENPV